MRLASHEGWTQRHMPETRHSFIRTPQADSNLPNLMCKGAGLCGGTMGQGLKASLEAQSP